MIMLVSCEGLSLNDGRRSAFLVACSAATACAALNLQTLARCVMALRARSCIVSACPLVTRGRGEAVCSLLPSALRPDGDGSDGDGDLLAEQRFAVRLAAYRAGHVAPPVEWLLPGSCLAEALEL
jgi:hypothetical protein